MTTTTVTNAADLMRTLRTARGGETILLAPGNYGDLNLSGIQPRSTVTIRSANPANDAVFESLKLTRVANLVFDDIDVSHALKPGEKDFEVAIRVNFSTNVTFVGIDASGSLNGTAFDDGNGIVVSGSSRIAILDSTFEEFNNAAAFAKSSDVIFAGNTIRTAREGVNIAEVSGGLFERNYITGIRPDVSKLDHSDAFQVQAGGSNGVSRDLVFNANVIMGDENQGIFIRSEKALSQGLKHSNIVITNNYVETNLRNAIAINDTDGVVVTNNSIRDAAGPGIVPGIAIGNLSNGVISGNIVPLIDIRAGAAYVNTNLAITNNIEVWNDKTKRGVSEASLFAAPTGSGDIDFSALGARAGSAAAASGAGFHSVAGIGNLAGSASAQLAAYLPQFDGHFATTYPL